MRTASKTNLPIVFFCLIFASFPALVLASAEAGAGQPNYSAADGQGRYRYMVTLGEAGAIQLVASNQVTSRSGSVEDAKTLARQTIQAEQVAAIQSMGSMLGREVEVSHYFQMSKNAIGIRLTEQEAESILSLPQVISVERERVYQLDTYRGPEFIGADQIWNGAAVPSAQALLGRGMIAAILDSGTNEDHPSFANDASCGHGIGGVPDKLLSSVDCASTDKEGRCNGPDSSDTGAHGSHVAGTVAGNVVLEVDDPNLNLPEGFTQISGVAPCAHLRTYKVCPSRSCFGFNIQAGHENVLLDGDAAVMNYSISGGRNPWLDFDRLKLDLVDAGIFVAASAGNTRPPNPDTGDPGITDPVGEVNHRGPWVTSVAASTRDENGLELPLMSITSPSSPPVETQDVFMNLGGASPASPAFQGKPLLRDSNQTPGAEGCNEEDGGVAFPTDFFDGAVALIQRGSCSFVDKINNAEAAGADMVIVWNNAPGILTMATEGTNIPAYSISQVEGQPIADFVAQNPSLVEMEFGFVPSPGDELATFSLRGPTPAPLADLQKPNITGPGIGIFAAHVDGVEYILQSGTSMSSPHVAGAALLVRQAHPLWTPMEVKSAMQMTANKEGRKDDFSTPWDWDDVGSGRVDLSVAALAGLVMDETTANFLAANPATGGDVKELNLPSVRDVTCDPSCTWTRTVSSTLPTESNWTVVAQGNGYVIDVQPSSFTLPPQLYPVFSDSMEAVAEPVPPEPDQVITITVEDVIEGPIRFGTVDFVEDGGQAPDAHITVAVQVPSVPAQQ